MPNHSVAIPGHTLEINTSIWSGAERIRCDGQTVSEKRSLFYITPHSFILQEGDERATYEVDVLTGWLGFDHGYIVRRNGIILAHRP
jgi:hypothetical protein